MRKLTVKRETLTALDKGDLAQVVAASVSCPIKRLLDLLTPGVSQPETDVPTLCHCP